MEGGKGGEGGGGGVVDAEGNGGEGRREGEGRRGEAEGRGQLPAWLDNDEGMAELLQVELHHLHLKIRLQKRLCKWPWQ